MLKESSLINITKFDLPISSINNIIAVQSKILSEISNSINDQKIPLVTFGVLNFNFSIPENNYSCYYDVPLKDPYTQKFLLLDIPKDLVAKYRLNGGEIIKVIGYIYINIHNNKLK